MFKRVLVANRSEIARRVMRTCRDLDIETVAVHSDADRDAPHVADADLAVRIGPPPAVASYLDVDRIVAAAVDTGCDAVHPGYGFLAENARFARAVRAAGLTFIGPSPEVIELMGDKAAAKRRLAAAGVPVVPGQDDDTLDDEALVRAAADVGFPLLVKAVAGGGGKGMRAVHDPAELRAALTGARREAKAAFGDDRVILERLIAAPRHVEVQVFGDQHGHVIHLLERECSIQRRHQKLVEEAPSPALDAALRGRMGTAAVTAGAEVGYEGAGTVEFLLDGTTLDDPEPTFAFLEMNTRLQVEHPVTELITGFDLVAWQLRIAAGGELPVTQDDVRADGHAIEVRLYAEDPVEQLPQTGKVHALEVPTAHDVRFDSGIEVGTEVTTHYDPMLAKLIVHAASRAAAVERLREVLAEVSVRGVVTNVTLLRAIADVPAFATGELTTGFLGDHLDGWRPPAPDDATIHAALAAVAIDRDRRSAADPWARLGPVRPAGGGGWPIELRTAGGATVRRHVRRRDDRLETVEDGVTTTLPLTPRAELVDEPPLPRVWVHGATGTHQLELVAPTRHADVTAPAGRASFTAPMPGSVLRVDVEPDTRVAAGASLVVVEAMKMEHPVLAPVAGTVSAVHVRTGDAVDAGTVLLEFDPDTDAGDAPTSDATEPGDGGP